MINNLINNIKTFEILVYITGISSDIFIVKQWFFFLYKHNLLSLILNFGLKPQTELIIPFYLLLYKSIPPRQKVMNLDDKGFDY